MPTGWSFQDLTEVTLGARRAVQQNILNSRPPSGRPPCPLYLIRLWEAHHLFDRGFFRKGGGTGRRVVSPHSTRLNPGHIRVEFHLVKFRKRFKHGRRKLGKAMRRKCRGQGCKGLGEGGGA